MNIHFCASVIEFGLLIVMYVANTRLGSQLRQLAIDKDLAVTAVLEKMNYRLAILTKQHVEELEQAKVIAARQSRSTMRGQASEQLAPLLINDLDPKDMRFVGGIVDYLVFKGLSAIRDGDAEADTLEVQLLEIKTGSSRLTAAQRAVRNAVKAGRVSFKTINLDEGNNNDKGHSRSALQGIQAPEQATEGPASDKTGVQPDPIS